MSLVTLWDSLDDYPSIMRVWQDGPIKEEFREIADMIYFVNKYGFSELAYWTIGFESSVLNFELKEEQVQ